jgi:hypothetical protein
MPHAAALIKAEAAAAAAAIEAGAAAAAAAVEKPAAGSSSGSGQHSSSSSSVSGRSRLWAVLETMTAGGTMLMGTTMLQMTASSCE